MSYRTSALIGQFFDERRHFDGEDSDFSYRMSKKGKLFWNPKAKFRHESSMAKKVTNNHKVRYHLKHLALSCAEFDGKVQARYCLVYLFFNGLISIAFGIKRFKLAEMKIGIAYFFSSLVFPVVLARYNSKKSIETISNDSNNNALEI
jgi:GT2 family glycosyltransferase